MNKEKALERLSELEKETAELRKVIDISDIPKLTAKEWLQDFISKPFDKVIIKDGFITYYRNDQWIFQQDLGNDILWCYYYQVWEIFEKNYSMNYDEIQMLHRDVVCKSLNCKGLTPYTHNDYHLNLVCKALNT